MKEYEQRFFKGRGTIGNTTTVPQLPITETVVLKGALGVDYTSDYVDDYHASDMLNMWNTNATLETMIGFRKITDVYHWDGDHKVSNGDRIYTMFAVNAKKNNSEKCTRMIVHCGDRLYAWDNFPSEAGVHFDDILTNIGYPAEMEINSEPAISDDPSETRMLIRANQSYYALLDDKAYIADGAHIYEITNGSVCASLADNATVPIVKIGCEPSGGGTEYQPFNMLTPQFIQTFVADGTSTEYYLSEYNLDNAPVTVTVYDNAPVVIGAYATSNGGIEVDRHNGKIIFSNPPPEPTQQGYDEGYAGVKVQASKTYKQVVEVTETFELSDIAVGQRLFALNENVTILPEDFYIERKSALANETTTEETSPIRIGVPESAHFYIVNRAANAIMFGKAPKSTDDPNSPWNYGFTVHYKAEVDDASYLQMFKYLCAYDNRLFIANHPSQPNELRWSQLQDAHYFPRISYVQDGSALNPITGLLPVGSQLAVLKARAMEDATIYLHTPTETSIDYMPKTYPSTESLSKVGCLAPRSCCNFEDTPVFLSQEGVKSISALSIMYERTIAHKSSRIDPRLLKLPIDVLSDAQFISWRGWLFCNFDGKVYMADSRYSTKTAATNSYEYEWYPLDGIGTYRENADNLPIIDRWVFASRLPTDDATGGWTNPYTRGRITIAPKELWGETANRVIHTDKFGDTIKARWEDYSNNILYWCTDTSDPAATTLSEPYFYRTMPNGERYLIEKGDPTPDGKDKIGGEFCPCTALCVVGDSLYFGTSNGAICRFNTDRMLEYDYDPFAYSYNDRAIECYVSTGALDFGYPHYHKTIRNRGNRVEFKSNLGGYCKFMWESDPNFPYNYERFCHGLWQTNTFDFNRINFNAIDFDAAHKKSLFPIRIRGKRFETCRVTLGNHRVFSPWGLKSIVLVCTPERFANR